MLVVIAIIAILVSLSIPSIRRSWLGAESSTCLLRLGGLGQAFAIAGASQGDRWPNLFTGDLSAELKFFDAGQVSYQITYFGQARLWAGSLIGTVWDDGDPPDLWTCPAVMRHGFGLGGGREQLAKQQADGAHASYYQSASLFTASELWDAEHPERWSERDRYRRHVGIHEIRHPSRKGALAELADFHGARILLASEAEIGAQNTMFVDGHVARIARSIVAPGIRVADLFDNDDEPRDIPFLTTINGFLGDDLRP